jgi:hypothetical protein
MRLRSHIGLFAAFVFSLSGFARAQPRDPLPPGPNAFAWTPPQIAPYRDGIARPHQKIRFRDSQFALRYLTDQLKQLIKGEGRPVGAYERVLYPFGGLDTLPVVLGAEMVLSVGLERFGTPQQLEAALQDRERLETTSENYAKYTYIYATEQRYHQRPFVGEDAFAIASQVYGLEIRAVYYFDDSGVYASSSEEIEAEGNRFCHVRLEIATDGSKPSVFYYFRTNIGAHTSADWLKSIGLGAQVSNALMESLPVAQPNGMMIKAPQGNVIHQGVIAELHRSIGETFGYIGLGEYQLHQSFALDRIMFAHYAGPFGLSEAGTSIELSTFRRPGPRDFEFASTLPWWRRVIHRASGEHGVQVYNATIKATHVEIPMTTACERALGSFFRSREIRGHSPTPVRIYM